MPSLMQSYLAILPLMRQEKCSLSSLYPRNKPASALIFQYFLSVRIRSHYALPKAHDIPRKYPRRDLQFPNSCIRSSISGYWYHVGPCLSNVGCYLALRNLCGARLHDRHNDPNVDREIQETLQTHLTFRRLRRCNARSFSPAIC